LKTQQACRVLEACKIMLRNYVEQDKTQLQAAKKKHFWFLFLLWKKGTNQLH